MSNMRTVVRAINNKFPDLGACPRMDFDGFQGRGIWFEGSKLPVICGENPINLDATIEDRNYDMGVHKELQEALNHFGWHAEPWDNNNLMAYPN